MTDDLRAEAAARHELHKNHPTHRPLSADYELIGLRGEESLSRAFDVPMDMMRRPNGDGGVDNTLRLRVGDNVAEFIVDVKTARTPANLIVEVGKVRPRTIYMLARYTVETDTASLLGWEWGATLLKAPTGDFGYGVINHYIAQNQLRPVDELLSRQSVGAFVGYDAAGHFMHYCHCGRWGSFGYGTRLLHDEFGQWFCTEHKPKERGDEDQTQERAGGGETGQADDEVGAAAPPAGNESQQAVDAAGEEAEEGWW